MTTEERYQEIKNDKTNHKLDAEKLIRKVNRESKIKQKEINKLGNQILAAL